MKKRLLDMINDKMLSPGVQFWFGFILGPTGLMILDLLSGNDE